MEVAARKCPFAFLEVFNKSFQTIKDDKNCVKLLTEQLNGIREHEEYPIIRTSAAWGNEILCMVQTYGDKYSEEELKNQFHIAILENDVSVAGAIYKQLSLLQLWNKVQADVLIIECCDLCSIYSKLETKVEEKIIKKEDLLEFIDLIGVCYDELYIALSTDYKDVILKYRQRN